MSETGSTKRYRPETRLVHGGTLRSQFGETSEALFLTQGYVYDSAEQCEARFKGQEPGFIYSRYSNPTIEMFERRMIQLEGAEAARSTATGMAAVTTAILAPLKAGDHVVASKALFGSCLYVVQDLLPRYGIETTLVDGLAVQRLGSAQGPRDAWRARARADRNGRQDRRRAGVASEDLAADLSRPRRSSASRAGEKADARRLDAGRLRGQGRQAGRIPL